MYWYVLIWSGHQTLEAGHWDISLYLSCPQAFPRPLPPSSLLLSFVSAGRWVAPLCRTHLLWFSTSSWPQSSGACFEVKPWNWVKPFFPQLVSRGIFMKVRGSWLMKSNKWKKKKPGEREDPLKVMTDCCWKIDLENTGAQGNHMIIARVPVLLALGICSLYRCLTEGWRGSSLLFVLYQIAPHVCMWYMRMCVCGHTCPDRAPGSCSITRPHSLETGFLT